MYVQSRPSRLIAVEQLNRDWVACPYCDEVWARPDLLEGERARCGNCHSIIFIRKTRSAERTIALMIAALILFITAMSFPFMRMEKSGLSNEISVLDAVSILWTNDMHFVALLCAGFILLFPLARILLLLFIGVSLLGKGETGRPHAWSFRLAQLIEPWTMAEIFMVGVIVSLVKVGKLADITLGPAFWSMTGLMIILTIGGQTICKDTVWHNIRGQL